MAEAGADVGAPAGLLFHSGLDRQAYEAGVEAVRDLTKHAG